MISVAQDDIFTLYKILPDFCNLARLKILSYQPPSHWCYRFHQGLEHQESARDTEVESPVLSAELAAAPWDWFVKRHDAADLAEKRAVLAVLSIPDGIKWRQATNETHGGQFKCF